MKMNKFFVAALAVTMALASCSKENGADKGKAGDGKETYAGVSITLPATTGTRALDPAAGIAGEKNVTTIGIYIVDVDNSRLDYDVLTVADDFTKLGNVYTATTAVKTVTGTKKVYVVANPTTNIQNKLASSGATAMNAIPFQLPETDFLTGTITSMVMSGAYTATGGELELDEVRTPTEAVDAGNLVDITIGRNLSKAVVQEGPDYEVVGGTTTLTWTLVSKSNDAYLLPQSVGTLNRGTVPASALDPTTGPDDNYWGKFSGTVGSGYIGVLGQGNDAKTATYAQSKYMFENKPTDMYAGNTTAARIMGVFDPAVIYSNVTAAGDKTDVGGSFVAGTDFYRSTIDQSYWTLAGRNAAIATSYLGHTADDFLQYTGGVGYYTIYVNDGASNIGVDRNSYYLMQINKVIGPGTPGEPGPLPPVQQDTNLGVNVTVLDWDFKKSEQDIN